MSSIKSNKTKNSTKCQDIFLSYSKIVDLFGINYSTIKRYIEHSYISSIGLELIEIISRRGVKHHRVAKTRKNFYLLKKLSKNLKEGKRNKLRTKPQLSVS